MPLVYEFKNFPKERDLVGDMLLAYGQLEFDVAQLLGYAFSNGNDCAGRVFFCVNGEFLCFDVFDVIFRLFFVTFGVFVYCGNVLFVMRYFKNIINYYVYC